MSQKTHDLVVKVGSYTDRFGNTKHRWQNIGVVLEGQYGPYIMLKPHINLAGIPKPDGFEDVPVSMFAADQNGPPDNGPPTGGYDGGYGKRDVDDEIPF